MSFRYALLLALLPAAAVAQAPTWSVLPTSPSNVFRFDDIEAPSPTTIYVASGDGEVWRSLDGGESWALRYTDPDERYFRSLGFVSETHGWVGTLDAGQGEDVLLETTDGGQTFTPATDRITGPLPFGICGIHALDDEAVYATGDIAGGAYFLRTLDGGQTWTSLDLSAQAWFLVDVLFLDRQRGFLVGAATGEPAGAIVLGTEDGGLTWTERYRNDVASDWAWKIHFPTRDVGYVSIESTKTSGDGAILKTTDGGQTWQVLPVPSTSMQGIGFVDEQTGWIGGYRTPQVTTDGGQTWSSAFDLGSAVNRFAFFGDSLAYAVAERVYRYGDPPTASEPAPPAEPVLWVGDPYPNPFPERVLLPYRLPAPAEVTLEVFDAAGRRVALVRHGLRTAGPDELLWTARTTPGTNSRPGSTSTACRWARRRRRGAW